MEGRGSGCPTPAPEDACIRMALVENGKPGPACMHTCTHGSGENKKKTEPESNKRKNRGVGGGGGRDAMSEREAEREVHAVHDSANNTTVAEQRTEDNSMPCESNGGGRIWVKDDETSNRWQVRICTGWVI